jgi:type II secretory pathway pseudopilin PulG
MTLLESLVALVVLGTTAAAFLGALHVSSRTTRDVEEWLQAVSYAEMSMELTKLGPGGSLPVLDAQPAGFARDVSVRPWAGGRGVEQVTVSVSLPDGGEFVLHRLVRAP